MFIASSNTSRAGLPVFSSTVANRELRTILGEAPRGDGKRVVILAEAQSLGVEAANALLKSLEEPRPGVCFLLLAPQRERLLPTLVSRGWVVTLAWPEAGTPSTPELFQWEEALAEFMASGQGWLDKTSGKGAVDAALARRIVLSVQKAQADAIRMINEANPNHNYLALRSMEAMEKVADGKATKLIVPSDMQNLAATVSAIKEISGEVTE